MKNIIILFSFFMSQLALANLHLSPPNFDTAHGRAVFVDFKTAHYRILFDMSTNHANVVSSIEFENTEEGFPLFDLVSPITKVLIDGEQTEVEEISLPGGVSRVQMVKQSVKPGKHRLVVSHRLKKNVCFGANHVKAAFWIRDLKDRLFIEQYVPTNLEYDQYQMTIDLTFEGPLKLNQEIIANGTITKINKRSWRIEFPDFYTAASPFLHLTRKGAMRRKDFTYKSISGREIPVTVYSRLRMRTNKFAIKVKEILKELEADYGPYAHASLIAFGEGRGGMEHAGATQTSLAALDHEMLHFYFAKGVMPANGNSGWIDEAIASWRDKGYPRSVGIDFTTSGLAGHSVYARNTDSGAYSKGAMFLSHIDYLLSNVGGLKAFLKGYFAVYKFQMMTNDHFINNLEFFSGLNLRPLFEEHIFKKPGSKIAPVLDEHPVHQELSESEYQKLL